MSISMVDSFTEVSRFGCLTRLDGLLKETNNKNWVSKNKTRNKTTKSYVPKFCHQAKWN